MRKHAIHLIVSFVLLACPVLGTSGGECSEFSEDFSGLSPNEWQGGGGNWYFSGETLVIQDIDPGSLAFAETGFHPADYFTIDVTVDKVQFPSGSSFGIYPFTSGDVFFDVDGHTVDHTAPQASINSTSTVGLPRESRISLPVTSMISVMHPSLRRLAPSR